MFQACSFCGAHLVPDIAAVQNAIGDGGLYTLISALLVVSCLGFFVLIKKGKKWRDPEWSFKGRKEKLSEA